MMDEELSAELLERAGRDQAARMSLMHRGQPQIHGTQYQVIDGVLELWTVRDPSGLDQRRAALGLEPEAANRARLLAAEGLTGEHHEDERASGGRPAHHGPEPYAWRVPDAAPPIGTACSGLPEVPAGAVMEVLVSPGGR